MARHEQCQTSMRACKHYTQQEMQNMVRMYKEGVCIEGIALALGRTATAVATKLKKTLSKPKGPAPALSKPDNTTPALATTIGPPTLQQLILAVFKRSGLDHGMLMSSRFASLQLCFGSMYPQVVVVSVCYLKRIKPRLTDDNFYNMFSIACFIAFKYLAEYDRHANTTLGYCSTDLWKIEAKFLKFIDYRLYVTEEGVRHYIAYS